MPRPSEGAEDVRSQLIGLGERSIKKSYYPELLLRIAELERFRSLLDHATDAVFLVETGTGRLSDVNEAACRLTGLERDVLLGRVFSDLCADLPEAAALLLRGCEPSEAAPPSGAGATKSRIEGEMPATLARADGTRTPLAMTLRAHAVDGRGYAVAVARDVSERLEAEREIERGRAFLGDIIDSMPSALAGIDRQGLVRLWNAKAEELAGVPAREALGRPLADVLPTAGERSELIFQAMAERRPMKAERLRDLSGESPRWLDMVVYPLRHRAQRPDEAGAVVRVDDVTARVRFEEMMVQTEKMISVAGLAAGMAHEINNPLAGILQGAQNIQRRLSPGLARNQATAAELGTELEAIRGYLERRDVLRMLEGIREAGERAAKIVSDMLGFARRQESRHAPADLAGLLDRALELAGKDYDLKKRYDFRRVRIERDFDPDLPPVPCVATQIEQVALNILTNAAQAMCGMAEPRIVLRLRREGDMARVEIRDNGPGLSAEARRRAFEPFFTTKESGDGVGLGLSVSYFIVVQNHHGELSVDSAAGKGAAFVIRLPIER